ncbi:MAG: hypothetical protein WC418_04645, partial [Candidatus Omnitrophota bacterium]
MKINKVRVFVVLLAVISLGISNLPGFASDSASSQDETGASENKVIPASKHRSFKKPSQLLDPSEQSRKDDSENAALRSAFTKFGSTLKDIRHKKNAAQSEYKENLSNAQTSQEKKEVYAKYLSILRQLQVETKNAVSVLNSTVNSVTTTTTINSNTTTTLSANNPASTSSVQSVSSDSQISVSALSDPNGKVVFNLADGAFTPANLNNFWAKVTYGGKTYYWELGTGVLSVDGKTVTLQLGSEFDGKTMTFAFFGIDTSGKQTSLTNEISVVINSAASPLTVPTVTAATCDVNGNVTFTLSSAFKPSDLQNFWAQVTYDGKTYYWELTTGVLSADGKTVTMQLGSEFDAKTMKFAFYGIDTIGKRTGVTNAISVVIDSNASSLTVPTVTAATCDVNG